MTEFELKEALMGLMEAELVIEYDYHYPGIEGQESLADRIAELVKENYEPKTTTN